MIELTLEQIQDIQFDILCTIVSLCEKNNLRHYLFGGTLLGAVRHGDFIPWDDDIDIAMPRDDFEKFEQICRSELPSYYTFVNWKDDWRIKHNISKVCDIRTVFVEKSRKLERDDYKVELGVFVDIFPLDGVPKGRVCKILHGHLLRLARMILALNSLRNSKERRFHKQALVSLLHAWGNESRIKWLHAMIDRISKKYSEKSSVEWASYLDFRGVHDYLPKAYVGDGTTVMFRGQPFVTFSEYDKYLRITYGDYMTMPPPESRKPPHKHAAYCRTEWRRIIEGSGLPVRQEDNERLVKTTF